MLFRWVFCSSANSLHLRILYQIIFEANHHRLIFTGYFEQHISPKRSFFCETNECKRSRSQVEESPFLIRITNNLRVGPGFFFSSLIFLHPNDRPHRLVLFPVGHLHSPNIFIDFLVLDFFWMQKCTVSFLKTSTLTHTCTRDIGLVVSRRGDKIWRRKPIPGHFLSLRDLQAGREGWKLGGVRSAEGHYVTWQSIHRITYLAISPEILTSGLHRLP